jgi:hypothetical protein
MKRLLMTCAILAVLTLSVTTVSAQTPIVQIVFDEGLNQQTKVCVTGSIDSFHVVARNFNIWMTGIEFAIQYPMGIGLIGENVLSDLSIGGTPMGISLVWMTPQNAFATVKLMTVYYICNVCYPDNPIIVLPHWQSGFVRATRYPDLEFINGIGWTSVFCPDVIPVEESTWGQIKSMYE